MKKIIYTGLLSTLLGLMAACTADPTVLPDRPEGLSTDGVEITLRFPDMQRTASRAFTEKTKIEDLDLFLFVFDGSHLLQTIHIDPEETEIAQDEHKTSMAAMNHVKFKTTLPQTDNEAVIHIVAVDDKTVGLSEQIERLGYGLEDIIMPSLFVSGDEDAYWQRIELGCPITQRVEDAEGKVIVEGTEDKIKAAFANPIPLIRNFAKIELIDSVDDPNISFTVLGWTVVNDLDGGSVVPYFSEAGSADVQFPKFADWSVNPATIENYGDLTTQGYPGVSLSGAVRRHTVDQVDAPAVEGDWHSSTGPIYLYERKVSSVNPLFLLIYANYQGVNGYYKLALGHREEETGLMTEYNVLRNICYTVNITAVSTPGYGSAAEAANAPASNNVSGDVTTKDMFSISDGVDMLYVNQLNFIITQSGKEIDFRFRYMTDIRNSHTQNDSLVEYDWEGVGLPKDGGEGVVIQSWSGPAEETDENNPAIKWSQIKIRAKDPTDELRQESFIIFSKPGDGADGTLGLSRKITLILRNPWDYLRAAVYPGLWQDDTHFPDYDPDSDQNGNPYIGAKKGAPLTLFLELPSGLPEAMFPLSFTVESDRQNVENAGVGNAVVDNGESLFPGVTEYRIKFVKTITWSDYAPDGEKSTAASRVLRIRLSTTTNISSLPDDTYLTTLRVYNEYFNLKDVRFMRDQNTDVDIITKVTQVYNHTWNFTDAGWAEVRSKVNDGNRRNFSESYDGLTLSHDNYLNTSTYNQRCFDKGQDNEGAWYFLSRYNDNQFSFTLSGPKPADEEGYEWTHGATIRIKVSDDTAGGHTAGPLMSVAFGSGTVTVVPDNSIGSQKDDLIYTATKLNENTTVTIKPTNNTNPYIRFFEIEVTETYTQRLVQ